MAWTQLTDNIDQDVELLTYPEQLINQSKVLLKQCTDYHFWRADDSANQDLGIIACAQTGRYWSVLSVSTLGLSIYRDAFETCDTMQIIAKVLGQEIAPTAVKSKGCMCGAAPPPYEVQKLSASKGEQVVSDFVQDLIKGQRVHKAGLVFQQQPDEKEETIMAKQTESSKLITFYKALGELVNLQTHTGYNGDTGKFNAEVIYAKINEHELLYHLVTKLPYKEKDDQQLERKRHIGNDNVIIVLREFESEQFEPDDFITSHQIKVYLVFDVIEENQNDLLLKIKMYSRGVNQDYLKCKITEGWLMDEGMLENINILITNACLSAYTDPELNRRLNAKWKVLLEKAIQ
ncbi:Rap/ran-GAP_family protein [Hexamita inflata]|uniref:Rap/ran-GAP_family protein n=1 Tax=Hexamita inflata TaxID=28002 RepID=A0ABP1GJU7_9EUKA